MTENPEGAAKSRPARSGFLPWLLALAALYATAVGFVIVGIDSEGASGNDWIPFLGRFHFVLLHLPIGLLLLLGAIEALAIVPAFRPAQAASTFILWFAALGAIGASICGILLSKTGGYGEDLLEKHLWGGIAVAIGTLLALIVKTMLDHKKSFGLRILYKGLTFATVGVLMLTSHFGGSLTHGEEYLTKHMPDSLRGILGLAVAGEVNAGGGEVNRNEMSAYYGIVEPILEAKCWSCHQESKQKGELRMDTFALMLQGGESGPPIVSGDAEGSELFYRITTDDEDDRMPPEGKDQLTEAEVEIIRWWIQSGADENRKLVEIEQPDTIKDALEEAFRNYKPKSDEERAAAMKAAEEQAKAAEEKAKNAERIAAIAKEVAASLGVPLLPLAQGEDKLQFTAVNVTETFGDAELAKLAPVAGALADVNIARTKVTDTGMSEIGKMASLERLRLERTEVTDAGLEHLSGLEHLEYLNLYGTKVTDAGLNHLSGLKNLKKLFVWETGVTETGAQMLVDQIPDLVVNMGWDKEIPAPPTPEPQPAQEEGDASAPAEGETQPTAAEKPAEEEVKPDQS